MRSTRRCRRNRSSPAARASSTTTCAFPAARIPGVRYAFQYGVPLTNPALTSAWARELAHAAAYTAPNYPPSQGLPALREAVCDYLARRRGVQAAAGGRGDRRTAPSRRWR